MKDENYFLKITPKLKKLLSLDNFISRVEINKFSNFRTVNVISSLFSFQNDLTSNFILIKNSIGC